ncbi:hypothetical protein ACPOM7_15135 [Peribacillus castrilensis]|uniref:Uncharacterized protein n=1 Tax=Peribacillus simplex TaxID=1478 RepID=A0AAN2PHZ1_9BACI|nr:MULTISPECIES: hypothetical protein [Bacillaceae]MCF7625497.1 hypothetical protein [Peribacillus frigoritolerans]MCP1156051.1 hypothetical protein [Peribacillus frigoritolerans]MCT1391982.1 hypothetical protein [Peribacillus frigoritolerans]NCT39635.1 hypothetical protein [Peribacillus frigoritolerans]PAL11279.1 hypothetical protein B8W99_17315 [Peribacillus simplex]
MNVMDAKIISTQYGLETYLDVVKSVDVRELQYPTETEPFFEITVGIEYFLLKEERYYDSRKNYFRIRMDSDFGSVTLVETKTESLFAVKNAGEKDATKKLVGEWLIKTQAFKQVINELIVQKKMEDVQTEGDIQAVLGTIRFLEKLLEIEAEDIVGTIVEGKPEFVH